MKVNLANCAFFLSLLIRYTSTYKQLTIEDDDLCSPIKKRKIHLEKEGNSGLIVSQYNLNEHYHDWTKNFRCKFQVSASSSKEGVIAVIQELVFRKNPTTDECIDYIQFTRKDGSSSQKFCGRFNAEVYMDHNLVDPLEHIVSGTSVVDKRGELDVVIFVAKERLTQDEEMDVKIVFTAYRNCNDVLKRDTTYKPCSIIHPEFCIYSGFFSDDYLNCPLADCKDEQGCLKPDPPDTTKYDGNKVLIGALSAVSIMFLIFIVCLWICKTYKIFCWSQNFANPSTAPPPDLPTAPRVMEMDEQTGSRTTPQDNSANLDEDKDLPPSYDSLFPTR